MYLIYSASADNYITNKIISTTLSASDANVGKASTLDLFKIYDETTFTGFTGSYSAPTEISRLLLKFDLTEVSASIRKYAELDGFKAFLSLKDINGSQIAPNKFNVAVYPLSKSWDEGRGSDIYSFNDLDQSNWMTASYSNGGYDLWHSGGASSLGSLNSDDIDIIGSGSIAGSSINFVGTQYFLNGHEDLHVDVTTAVSATLGGFMQDHGFLVAFSGSEETDTKTRFVKRFASRHARNEYLRPSLVIKIDDSVIDQRSNMFFNTSGSLFLENKVRGLRSNIISGSTQGEVPLTGANSLYLIVHTGSFAITASAGEHAPAEKHITGLYSASLAVDRFSSTAVSPGVSLYTHAAASGSLKMYERWMDRNQAYTYFTGSFKMSLPRKSTSDNRPIYKFAAKNLKNKYKHNEIHRIDLHVRDNNKIYKAVRRNFGTPSLQFEQAYYRIKDLRTGNIIIPFTKQNNATRISVDSDGMYFRFSTKNWPKGRSYTIDILVVEGNDENTYETGVTFKVV